MARTVNGELGAAPGKGQVALSKAVRNALADAGSMPQWMHARENCCPSTQNDRSEETRGWRWLRARVSSLLSYVSPH